jgi:hypothetical protein
VLWTQPFPFVHRVRTFKCIEDQTLELFEAHERGELHPQEDASEFVRRQYAPDTCMKAIAQAWNDALSPQAQQRLAGETP